jgi:O-antigen/teichoic acid export membrane protein
MFSGAFAVIYMRIDQVMLKHYLDNYAVGIYSVAAQLSEYWYIFPLIIVNSLVPAIVNARTAGEEVYKRRKAYLFKLIIGVSVFIALIFTVFADFFIRVIYGANYLGAVGILRIYVWGGLGMSLGLVVNQLFIVENRTKMYFVANFLSMLINVILNIIMIPKFGMSGAAFATLIAYSFIPMPYFIFKSKSKGNTTVYEAVS